MLYNYTFERQWIILKKEICKKNQEWKHFGLEECLDIIKNINRYI